jgi:hypothetical protein
LALLPSVRAFGAVAFLFAPLALSPSVRALALSPFCSRFGAVALTFHRRHFRKSAAMAFFTSKFRRHKRTQDFEGEFEAGDARTETEHVAVVVFA